MVRGQILYQLIYHGWKQKSYIMIELWSGLIDQSNKLA